MKRITYFNLDDDEFLESLLTIAKDAFFLKASATKLFPSIFSPLIAKNTSFLFIVFELIEISLKVKLFEIDLFDCSLIIFNFKLFDKCSFFIFIESSITFLSEKNNFLFP